ncbi:MAG: BMP family ABC transporter substrate-binding protein [Clostridiaceae bacterium]|nr:BMP family ABC transporter substrate-binding protein [Clostridiaceae bacterium]
MKKLTALLLAMLMIVMLAACSKAPSASDDNTPADNTPADNSTPDDSSNTPDTAAVKIGVILVGDENVGYDFAHIDGIKKAAAAAGISEDQIVWKYNITEDEKCYDTATDLVELGCNYIFSDSYSHQSYMQQAASENPDVTFISMTGDVAATSGLSNFKNAFNDTFQSRYVSGVVAGMKLAELVADGKVTDQNKNPDGTIKLGYVGAFPYAEVVSGYTAFYLGVKSVVDNVAMSVSYTNSWYDPTAEAEAANSLISNGCIILSQHADSTGAPSACQAMFEAGTTVYCVGYNVDMLSVAPDAALTSAQNDWSVYYTYAFNCIVKGEEIATDWAEGFNEGAVMISALGNSCAEGTAEKVAEVEAAIKDGSFNVFDCSTFTVGGEHLTSYTGAYGMNGQEAIKDGVFQESTLRSAPYFDLRIDGITELN